MANTLPSFNITSENWVDLNTLTGIAVGTALDIQNQSSFPMFLAISSTTPALNFSGFAIPASLADVAAVSAGEDRVWILGNGPVSVQEG